MNERSNELVEKPLNLVWAVIRKSHFRALDPAQSEEDLFQIGCIGLVKASRAYRPNSETTFLSYAYTCIWREIATNLRRVLASSRDGMLHNAYFDAPMSAGTTNPLWLLVPSDDETPESMVLETVARDYVDRLQIRNPVLCDILLGEVNTSEAGRLLGVSQSYASRLANRERAKLKIILSA